MEGPHREDTTRKNHPKIQEEVQEVQEDRGQDDIRNRLKPNTRSEEEEELSKCTYARK